MKTTNIESRLRIAILGLLALVTACKQSGFVSAQQFSQSSASSNTAASVVPPTTGLVLPPTLPSSTPASGNNNYYNFLKSSPLLYSSLSLRTQQEVVANTHYGNKSLVTTTYDANMDAALFYVFENSPSVNIGDQIRHKFTKVSSGNLLFYWEVKWPEYWAQDIEADGVNNYKAFQFSNDGTLNLEIRNRFNQVNAPNVARIDVRGYGNHPTTSDVLNNQSGEFIVQPNVWTSYWALIDYDSNTFSLWVGDENRPPVAIHVNSPVNFAGREVNQFWFEFNTSQSRIGPEAHIWGRNSIILRNVDSVSLQEIFDY